MSGPREPTVHVVEDDSPSSFFCNEAPRISVDLRTLYEKRDADTSHQVGEMAAGDFPKFRGATEPSKLYVLGDQCGSKLLHFYSS